MSDRWIIFLRIFLFTYIDIIFSIFPIDENTFDISIVRIYKDFVV